MSTSLYIPNKSLRLISDRRARVEYNFNTIRCWKYAGDREDDKFTLRECEYPLSIIYRKREKRCACSGI